MCVDHVIYAFFVVVPKTIKTAVNGNIQLLLVRKVA